MLLPDPPELASCLEALHRAGPRSVVSHELAAQLLGIELLDPPVTRRLTVPRNRSRLVVPGWEVTRSDVDPADQLAGDGLRVTAPLRTVTDLARVLDPGAALVAADSAVRRRLAPADELVLRLQRAEGRGAARVRQVGRLVDPFAESVLESLMRWTLHEAGLPAPRTQYVVHDGEREVARVDFCWPAQRLVVEADGFAFHSDRLAYRRDRQRTNDLVRLGWRVLRFTYEDVRSRPEHVVGLVSSCLRSARRAA